MALINTSFHSSIDLARGYQSYTPIGWKPFPPPFITLRERNLTYQFFTHFHPYVPALIQRLNDGGLPELEDADTTYLPQPNPVTAPLPLAVIPNSTRATLLADVTATPAGGGAAVSLTAWSPMTLADGTTVSVASGTTIGNLDGSSTALEAALSFALPGLLPVSSGSGIQNVAGAGAVIIFDSTAVTLPAGGTAVLTSDGLLVLLPANASVAIRSGSPRPFYYLDDFAARYTPGPNVVQQPYPVKNLDFTTSGAYAIYNWELFFHAPLLIAVHLSQNQKFQDAQNWFH